MTPSRRSGRIRFSQTRKHLSLAVAFLCCVAPLSAQMFVSFDAPDAGTLQNQGTFPVCISESGVIAGQYIDAGNLVHGFVRSDSGMITEFDPPGLVDNFVNGINHLGQVVGYGSHVTSHGSSVVGFQRNQNGQFVPIGPPGALDTFPDAINDSGEVAGFFDDIKGVAHGFLRDASGVYTVFNEPNASMKFAQGTFVRAMNANRTTTGYYNDASTGQLHGFILDRFGNFTSFDPSDSTGTDSSAINRSGQVTGTYSDSSQVTHSFLRGASGSITSFEVSGSIVTFATGINDAGTIVGQWDSSENSFLGFERVPSGSITSFSASPPSNTTPAAINNAGHITGYYVDSNGVVHGFVK
jgi:hypothetical protein